MVLLTFIIILLVLTAFEPLRYNDFVDYDNNTYIFENMHVRSGLTGSSIQWAFTTGYAANWHPLTWLSHMLDIELFGLNPHGHHLHNLFLHLFSTVLLLWLLYAMTGAVWPSAFTAIAFGIHPLRVESVAWVAERKDVLSMFFFLLTLAAYLYYVKRRSLGRYLLVLLSFALGLMAKPMLVTLPIILLLLDWWPLRRLRIGRPLSPDSTEPDAFLPFKRLIAEKIPLFVLTVASCIITYIVQQHGGSMTPIKLATRILNMTAGYMAYIYKIIWPQDLAVLYPYPIHNYPLWPPIIASILLALITLFAVYHYSQRPYRLMGWLWYLVTLIPVIGLVQVGMQRMADRYSCLPSIGIFLIISWECAAFVNGKPVRRGIIAILAIASVTAMLVCTRIQVTYWKNTVDLYQHTIAVTQDNYIMHNNLAVAYLKQGRPAEAEQEILRSLAIQPDYVESRLSMAYISITKKQFDEAFDILHKILEDEPDNAPALFNAGVILEIRNSPEEALRYYEKTIQADPNHFKAISRIGTLYMNQGRWEEAITCFRRSLAINPRYAEAQKNLQQCLQKYPNRLQRGIISLAKHLKTSTVTLQYMLTPHPIHRNFLP